MPGLNAIVCGSVAVTRDGRRCGVLGLGQSAGVLEENPYIPGGHSTSLAGCRLSQE
jgi:hypothetical protein